MIKYNKSKLAAALSLLLLNQPTSFAEILANKVVKLALDENTGTVALDSSGNSNNATLHGTTWLPGKSASALSFNGIDDYADLANDNANALYNLHKQNFSLAAWIKPTSALGHRSGLINRWGIHQGLFYNADKTFTFIHRLDSGNITVTSAMGYEPGEFYHVAVSIDGENGKLSMYINGDLVNSHVYTPEQATYNLWRPWRLGVKDPSKSTTATRENFAGLIDEVHFFDAALSDAEAKELWQEHGELPLLVDLKFDENSGTVGFDSTVNNYDASLQGASWVEARNNSGLNFDGVNTYAQLANTEDSALDLIHQNNHSISAWFKPNEALGHRSGIITRWGVHQGLFYNADKTISYIQRAASGTKIVTSTEILEPGKFYFITASVDSNQGEMNLYVNGKAAGNTSFDAGDHSIYDLWRPWRLGVKDVAGNTPEARESLSGIIDDVQFHLGAASASEATTLWQKQLEHCNLGDDAGTGTGNIPAVLTDNDFLSFEQSDVPSQWQASRGMLSLHGDHNKNGSQSLQWDWVAGDSIEVTDIQGQGLDPNKIDKTNYTQSSFRIWLYNKKAIEGDQLKIEFYDDQGNLQYHYPVNLNFTGWRAASVKYRTDMSGDKSSQNLTSMKINAPVSTCSGQLYIDLVDFTGPKTAVIGADRQVPMASTGGMNHWTDMLRYEAYTQPTQVTATAQEKTDTETIKALYISDVLENERNRLSGIIDVNEAITKYDELGITINGDVISANEALFGPYHIHKNFGIKNGVIDSYILVLVRDYIDNGTEANKERFIKLIRYMLDQGFADGSLLESSSHIGYSTRSISSAVLLMKAELKAAGLWEEAYKMLHWYNTVEQIWQPVSENVSESDHARTRVPAILGTILHIDDPDLRVHYLKGYRQHIDTWLTTYSRGSEGLKPDYSGFHHNTHFPGYTYGSIASISSAVRYLSKTEFSLSREKFDFIKRLVFSYIVQHTGKDMTLSLSGRNAFVTPTMSTSLIQLGQASESTQERDSFYAAYNRLFKPEELITEGVSPESNPSGFWQFNYRPMGVYREENWVANIKGLSKYFWGTEIYTTANRYGRYQSYGGITINYQLPEAERGDPREAAPIKGLSGYVEAGWDWNKMPGATTKLLPFDELVAAKNRQDEWSDEGFSGALRFGSKSSYYVDEKLEGECGLYGLNFKQRGNISPTHDDSFSFKKSVFACNGMMIALGSDINSTDSQSKIATTLFQQNNQDAPYSLIENGVPKTTSDYSNTLTTERNWFVDLYGTGYYVKSGGNIEVKIANQESPNHKSNSGNFSYGDVASAWIDHGTAPANGKYEYVILPNKNAQDMMLFSMHMQMGIEYKVWQQDSNAHILSFTSTGNEGYAIYEASSGLQGRYIEASDQPVLAMAKLSGSQLSLSLSNPDHNFTGSAPLFGANQIMPITITLKGKWSLGQPVSEVSNIAIVGDNTVFTINTTDGKAYDMSLTQVN